MTYQHDTFTDTPYTPLENHVGETNCTWNRLTTDAVPNQQLISPTNTTFRSGYNSSYGVNYANGSEHFTSGYTVPTANYLVGINVQYVAAYGGYGVALDAPSGSNPELSGVIFQNGRAINNTGLNNNSTFTNDEKVWLFGRVQGSFQCYALALDRTANSCILSRVNSGFATSTNLATYSMSVVTGTTYTLGLQMSGTTIQGLINGSVVLSVTDSTVTSAGFVGMRIDGGDSPVAGWQVDNFNVTDIGGSGGGLAVAASGANRYIPGIGIRQI
jgi:hypothetical protein